MALVQNELTVVDRVVGNREPLGATLTNLAFVPLNLTGKTITFRMILISDGSVKVNDASAALDDATNGEVSYTPAAIDVDTAGLYACYFTDDDTIDRLFPYDGANLQLNLMAETARAQ